jgi:hypothetical protein
MRLIPVLTIIGLQFSFLLAGGIIIENVFYLPGLGRLVFQAITQRDLIVVRSVVILLVFAVIVVTFLVDLAYAAADPRLRRRRRHEREPLRPVLSCTWHFRHPAFVTGLCALGVVHRGFGTSLVGLDAVRPNPASTSPPSSRHHRSNTGLEQIISAAICFP